MFKKIKKTAAIFFFAAFILTSSFAQENPEGHAELTPEELLELENAEEKRERLTKYLNGLNLYYKTFKYYLSPDGRICLDLCIPAKNEVFDAEFIYGMLNVLIQHLQEHLAELMEQVWLK